MATDPRRLQAALALREARAQVRAIPRVSETFGIEGLDAAYDVAALNTAERIREGRRVVGKKVGLTSKAVQAQLGVDQPDFGVLFDDMEVVSGDALPMDMLIHPKVEAEFAFVVARDLSQVRPSYGEFLASLAYVVPAIEVVDSAIEGWRITLVDTVADNASCGRYVLGNQPFEIGRANLAEVPMRLTVNGELKSEGIGAACLGHPLCAAYWLARTAACGDGLRAGEVILAGALGPMVPLNPGAVAVADFGVFGTVTCRASERSKS